MEALVPRPLPFLILFLSKAQLYPDSVFRMTETVQETYIRQLLEVHARARGVVVQWHCSVHATCVIRRWSGTPRVKGGLQP